MEKIFRALRNAKKRLWRVPSDESRKYILVVAVFLIFISYTLFIERKDSLDKPEPEKETVIMTEWDITPAEPEKIFEGTAQGRAGDWYRVGFSTRATEAVSLDISLWSALHSALIASADIPKSEDYQYQEFVFQVPSGGPFDSVRLSLKKDGSEGDLPYASVKTAGFFVSRLGVKSFSEAARLNPSIVGNASHQIRVLARQEPLWSPSALLEASFVAQADFMDQILLNAQEIPGNKGYLIEILEKSDSDPQEPFVSVKKVALKPGELNSFKRKSVGYQAVPVLIRLKRGQEYRISLSGIGDLSRGTKLMPLDELGTEPNPEGLMAVSFGQNLQIGDESMLSGAKVEDVGDGVYYDYSLRGNEADFFNIFESGGNVKFDKEEGSLVGEQKKGTFFTYRLAAPLPFGQIAFHARYFANAEEGIKLEYSFDNATWEVIPVTGQERGSLVSRKVIQATGGQKIVYVRVSYDGKNKKTGYFSLENLSVDAQLIR